MTALARARRGAHPQDVLQRLFLVGIDERSHQLGPLGQDLGGQGDQAVDADVAADARRARADGGGELQRAHAARPHVTEPLDGIETVGSASLRGQPRVDQRVAVPVGQGVDQQAGQAPEGLLGQGREGVRICSQRHGDGGDLDAASGEGRVVLEHGRVAVILQRDGPDGTAP